MKKLILILLMATGSLFAQNVKVATPANASQNILSGVTVNNSTNMVVPGTFTVSGLTSFNGNFTGIGADYLLNNQTLTGNGSIITRVLGDVRYSPIGGVTTNSNTFSEGSSNDFYNVTVRNLLRVNVSTILNTNLLVNGNVTVTNNAPIVAIVSTNASQIIGGGSLARFEAYVPGHVNGSIFGAAGSTNATITGSFPGDTTIRGAGTTRILFGNGTELVAYFDNIPAIKSLILTNGTTLNVANLVTSGTNNSSAYRVGGVLGYTGAVTNMASLGTSNVEHFATGILTNVSRIP